MNKFTPLEIAFYKQLRPARKAKGYTQEQVAEAVSTSARWYQLVEQGRGKPNLDLTLKLQTFLELDLTSLKGDMHLITPTLSSRQLSKGARAAAKSLPQRRRL